MIYRRTYRPRGVTLIELLVALVIGTMLTVAVIDVARTTFRFSLQEPQALHYIDQSRGVESTFMSELRDASYGSDGSYPLYEASTTEIIFFSPYHMGGSVARVRYFASSTASTSNLYKGVTLPTGSPASYVLANEKKTLVATLAPTTTPIFTYYDQNYFGSSTPLAQPVSISNVTFVQMLLVVPKGDVHATGTFTLTAGASVRNLKSNLSN
jgi:prepilin-type N-terminal cleavage/methylation domain-containing protein